MLVSNLIPVIAYIHISNLEPSELRHVGSYYMIYGFTYLVISVSIMANVFVAGNNLSSCDIEKENELIQTVYRETTENKTLKIVSVNYETIGADVFIDDKIAEDGVYSYKNDNRKLIIKNGKIEKMLTE